MKLSW